MSKKFYSKPRTEIIRPRVEGEISEAIGRLFSDYKVGAVALRDCLADEELEQLTSNKGAGFPDLPAFKYLFSLIARKINPDNDTFNTSRISEFYSDHGWHIGASFPNTPRVRAWLHLLGPVELWLARAADCYEPATIGPDIEKVSSRAFALPASIKPDPKDCVIFVDMGSQGTTGPSTFHMTEVPYVRGVGYEERLSVTCDVEFGSI